jgi:platelet-activating factor acetylhydrolase
MPRVEPGDVVFWPRLFRFFGLSPAFPQLGRGAWKHVASFRMRVRNGPSCQVFYPTEASSPDEPDRGHYMREAAVVGLANYSKISPFVFSGLVSTPHHVSAAESSILHPDLAKPLTAEGVPNLPVVLYSHGLAGSSEMYSVLCKDLASMGNVVVAVEHEDCSGSYARTEEGEDLFYSFNPPANFDFNIKEHVVSFRAPFLQKRVEEVKTVVSWLTSQAADAQLKASGVERQAQPEAAPPNNEDGPNADRLFQQISSHIDMSSLVLAGHSFGAATMYLAAQEVPSSKCAILLDTWSYPLPTTALAQGVQVPVLSVLSEVFIDNNFASNTRQLLSASKAHESYYIEGAVHQSFSDTPWFLPEWLARRANLSGKSDREVVRQANFELCAAFLGKHVPRVEGRSKNTAAADDQVGKRSDLSWKNIVKPF